MKQDYNLPDPIPVKNFQYRGYECQIMQHGYMYHLCGYAILPGGHPLIGAKKREFDRIDVHGGVTFIDAPFWKEGLEGRFAVGFDCAHGFDFIPSQVELLIPEIYKSEDEYKQRHPEETYKDEQYVTKEIKKMVDQLIELDGR